MHNGHGSAFPMLIVVLALMAACTTYLIYTKKNYEFRKTGVRWLMIASGALFIGLMVTGGLPRNAVLIATIFVIIATYTNLKLIMFCKSCGRVVFRILWFSKPKYCPRCGTELADQ